MQKVKVFLRKILEFFISVFIRVMAYLILPSNKGGFSSDRVKRIFIYAQMGIGNMVMFTPFLKALRSHFKNSQIMALFLIKNGSEQVLEGSNLVDEIIILWDKVIIRKNGLPFTQKLKHYFQRIKAIFEVAKLKPDLIIARFNSHYVDYALITLLSRAPYRVGHITSGGWKGKFDHLINYPVKMNKGEHEIDRNLRLAEKLAIPVIDKKTVIYISDNDEEVAKGFLRIHGIYSGEQFITIQVGTSLIQRWKQWDIKKWAMLTESILRQKIKVVILGSTDEKEMIINDFSNFSMELKPIVAAGILTLKQTAVIIRRSALLVCNDSGLMHIAVAMDTPVIAIYGPTDYTRTAPLGKKHIIIRKELACSPCYTLDGTKKVDSCASRICLDSIEVERVLDLIMTRVSLNSKG